MDPKFTEWIAAMEGNLMTQLSNRSKEIFSKQLDVPGVSAMWNSNLRDGKFRIKVDDCNFFDKEGKVMDTPADAAGWLARSQVSTMVEVSNIYFFNQKIGLVWKGVQMKVEEQVAPQASIPQGYAFLD